MNIRLFPKILEASVCLAMVISVPMPAHQPESTRVTVRPVFFVPSDQPISDYFKYTTSDKAEFLAELNQARAFYKQLLGTDTFDMDQTVSVYHSPNSHAFFTRGAHDSPDRFHRLVSELLKWRGEDRYSSRSIFAIIYWRPNNDGYFRGGGRTFNGLPGSGGGGFMIDIYDFKTRTKFLSTITHELGHAFGLPHADVYGEDMNTSVSIMGYNPEHHSLPRPGAHPIPRLEYPATPGSFLPEDYFRLAMNKGVFPDFHYNCNGNGLRNPSAFLGPMDEPMVPTPCNDQQCSWPLPSAPKNVVAAWVDGDDDNVIITWDPNPASEHVNTYKVNARDLSGHWINLTQSTQSPFIVSNPEDYTGYYVVAVNESGTSGGSNFAAP